jgi:hypothetical protein
MEPCGELLISVGKLGYLQSNKSATDHGSYAPELASKIAEQVAELARWNGYPLRCIVEPCPNA